MIPARPRRKSGPVIRRPPAGWTLEDEPAVGGGESRPITVDATIRPGTSVVLAMGRRTPP